MRTREDTCNFAVGHAVALGSFLHVRQVFFHLCLLFVSGKLWNQFAFGCKHHKGYTEHCVGTCRKNGDVVFYFLIACGCKAFKYNLCTF